MCLARDACSSAGPGSQLLFSETSYSNEDRPLVSDAPKACSVVSDISLAMDFSREREKERDRERDRERQRERQRETERETERERERERESCVCVCVYRRTSATWYRRLASRRGPQPIIWGSLAERVCRDSRSRCGLRGRCLHSTYVDLLTFQQEFPYYIALKTRHMFNLDAATPQAVFVMKTGGFEVALFLMHYPYL
jgi:hypothetical protein